MQASALSVNALLNPNIDTVIYHVKVRRDDAGHFQKARFFGFLRPTGAASPFMTFVWTKTTAESGVRFDCAITGMDQQTQQSLHDTITSKSTPATIISYVVGDNGALVRRHRRRPKPMRRHWLPRLMPGRSLDLQTRILPQTRSLLRVTGGIRQILA